jgi:hypothetical protein
VGAADVYEHQLRDYDVAEVCYVFPEVPRPEIKRENLLDGIDAIFNAGNSVVLLESNSGVGATTLLSQYARRYSTCTIAIFITGSKSISYCQEQILDVLGRQMANLLGKELGSSTVSEAEYRQLCILLTRRASAVQPIHFVIDGLMEIPKDDLRVIERLITDFLPPNPNSRFKFLISGSEELLRRFFTDTRVKPWQLAPFSISETRTMLSDIEGVTEQQVQSVSKACAGSPGKIASVKRLLQMGFALETILDGDEAATPDFVQMEWHTLKDPTDTELRALALLTFGRIHLTRAKLSVLADLTLEEIRKMVTRCAFLHCQGAEDSNVCFVSELHRKYAERKLAQFESAAIASIVRELSSEPYGEQSIRLLPALYEQQRDFGALIELLDGHYFERLLGTDRSISSLKQKAKMAVSAAVSRNDFIKLFQLCLNSSIIRGLDAIQPGREEVEALMAIGDYDEALARVSKAVTTEDRLHLLVIIAKIRKEKDLPCDLLPEIESLLDQLEVGQLGDRALEIAGDLIKVDPDLAFRLVDETEVEPGKKRAKEVIAASLGAASPSGAGGPKAGGLASENLNSESADDVVRQFAHEIYLTIGTLSGREAVAYVGRLATAHKVRALREWMKRNASAADAYVASEYALDALVTDATYAPRMGDLLDLALSLPHLADIDLLKPLLKTFRSQQGLVRDKSTNEEFVRLEMVLAAAEERVDSVEATERTVDLYLKVSAIRDVAIRLNCSAWMMSGLSRMSQEGAWHTHENIDDLLSAQLKSDVDEVLANTANQLTVCRSALIAITEASPDAALLLTRRFNTRSRRDHSAGTVAHALGERGDYVRARDAVLLIEDPGLYEKTYVSLLKAIERSAPKEPGSLPRLIDILFGLKRDVLFCEAAITTVRLSYKYAEALGDLRAKVFFEFEKRVLRLDAEWRQVGAYFEIATVLAEHDRRKAREYFLKGEDCRQRTATTNLAANSIVMYCSALAIKGATWLIPSNSLKDDYIGRLKGLIEQEPSPVRRCRFLTDFAMRCWDREEESLAKNIFVTCLRPLLEDRGVAECVRRSMVIASYPVAYVTSSAAAAELLATLDKDDQEIAVETTIDWLFRRCSLSDSYQYGTRDGTKFNYDEVITVCSLIEHLQTDNAIFSAIDRLSDSIENKSANQLTGQHKQNVSDRLEAIISRKLPDPENIRHDGFKIAAKATVARIAGKNEAGWRALVDAANTVPNAADRSATLGLVARCIPSKYLVVRKNAWELARQALHDVPSDYDHIERCEWLASLAKDRDAALATSLVSDAYLRTSKISDEDFAASYRRSLIDLAHNIDEKLADKLIDKFDSDEVRTRARLEAKRQLDVVKAKDKLVKRESNAKGVGIDLDLLPGAAWSCLGALNANRVSPYHTDDLVDHLKQAALLPLDDAFPIFSWVLENVGRTNGHRVGDVSRNILPSLFETTLVAAELASSLISRLQANCISTIRTVIPDASNFLVGPGSKEEARQFLSDWLQGLTRNEELVICDPYFSIRSLETLRFIAAERPDLGISVLAQISINNDGSRVTQGDFEQAWKILTDDPQPHVKIVMTGRMGDGKSPVHDRWWLGNTSGVRVGTSVDAIGGWRLSEMSRLQHPEVEKIRSEIAPLLDAKARVWGGAKLEYVVCFLG